ncbi:MAG: hypothetical protein ACKOAN_05985, partial [Chakrabartia sp.]
MSVHDFSVKKPDGSDQKLADFKGGPILIVNTASKCGFTPQYQGLEALQRSVPALERQRQALQLPPPTSAADLLQHLQAEQQITADLQA